MDTQGLLKKILDDYNSFFHDKAPERTSLERTKSFIYEYFFKEKQRGIAKYTERKTDFFGGVNAIVRGAVISAPEDIAKICEKSVTIRDNYLLLAISRAAFENGWIDENGLKAVIMKTRKIKNVPPALLQRECAEYGEAWERCLRILLHKTICDFFNSKGFIVNGSGSAAYDAKRKGRFSTKKRERDDRKERDLVNMYYEYRIFAKARSAGVPAGRFSDNAPKPAEKSRLVDEYKERAKSLLRAIDENSVNHERYKQDIIPIYFDEQIGAGIYLIGKSRFAQSALDTESFTKDSVCIPCIVSFYAGIEDELRPFVYVNELENGYEPIKARVEMDVEMCATLDEAFTKLAKKIRVFARKFSDINSGKYPPQTDEHFKRIMS